MVESENIVNKNSHICFSQDYNAFLTFKEASVFYCFSRAKNAGLLQIVCFYRLNLKISACLFRIRVFIRERVLFEVLR